LNVTLFFLLLCFLSHRLMLNTQKENDLIQHNTTKKEKE